MGRKIPGKKHRTVKDPYKQRAERYAVIKSKINKPPKSGDNDQPVPRSLKRLMDLKQKYDQKETPVKSDDNQTAKNKISKKKFLVNGSVSNNSSNPIKNLQKLKGESKKSFNVRINEAIKNLKGEKTYKDMQNDLPKERKPKVGENGEELKPKFKKKRKPEEPQLTKNQKRALKVKERKELIKEDQEYEQMFSVKRDTFHFGEVVHEPPSLKIKPRKAQVIDGAPRPARKDLLLNQLFEKKPEVSKGLVTKTSNELIAKQGLDLQGKRKDLPKNIRRKIEESQKEAIEAYRMMKMMKAQNKDD